jgi:glycine cleavage system aminomethyltransferase T
MLGDAPVAFAMVKWAHSNPGTALMLDVGSARTSAVVQPTLVFWKRA